MKYYADETLNDMLKKINFMFLIKSECNMDIYRFHEVLFAKECPFCKQEKSFVILNNNKSNIFYGNRSFRLSFLVQDNQLLVL